MYTYLLINIFSIFIPLLFSFERRLSFYKSWPALFPAILLTGTFFIFWDHYMTYWNVWQFNPAYVLGITIWSLPIEEWLFFFTIPYSCLFIYESLNFLYKKDHLLRFSKNISIVLIVILSITALLNTDKSYTWIKLSLTALMLAFVVLKKFPFMGKFYRAYLVSLIPFLIVNGILTSWPVVIYNDAENLGIRIFTIPVEDTMYSLLLLLMNVVLFEFFKKKMIPVKLN
ncbi:MAG: lycopene cyclase domain-containing protein [Bacteroidetes bacterium]|nr:lycopene cyclase domain-containing protein [Bacteroidota bacterium]